MADKNNPVLVVNGESYWQAYFGDVPFRQKRLQETSWVLRDGDLWVIDREEAIRPRAILWRVGAIRPNPRHRTVLEMIRLSGVPCVNSAETLLRCHDRLSSLNELRAAGVPTIDVNVVVGDELVRRIGRSTPFVVKAGNHHAGLGKFLVRNEQEWTELPDLLFAVDDYITTEPFIKYNRDIRVLALGDRIWAMQRRSAGWRANVGTRDYDVVDPPERLADWTRAAQRHLRADILALDILEADGSFVVLEANDTPGLSGFPEQLRADLAQRLLSMPPKESR